MAGPAARLAALVSGGRVRYDAFLSYSHAADGRLAPALQSALERLARPWYRLRALRVFRDETGLAVDPHLWGSIARAMDDSDWFVVLCSPEAAASEWVDREIHHWLERGAADRMLLVLTDGEIEWDAARADFDPIRSTALPPVLFGRFTDEPRYLDLRWARREDQLDPRHGRFRTAVAQLAAPMHGVARDELESEDLRQHRRTLRLARGATSVLVLLLVLALTLGVVALQQRAGARREAKTARKQAAIALREATTSESRQLAAEALTALRDGRSDVAQLLAVEAYRTQANFATRTSLLQTVWDQPALAQQLHGLADGPGQVALSSDGTLVAAVGQLTSDVKVWDRRTGQLLAHQPKGLAGFLAFAERGRLLFSARYGDARPGAVAVYETSSGRPLPILHADGVWAVSSESSTFARVDDASGAISVIDVRSGETHHLVTGAATPGSPGIAVSADGRRVALVTLAPNGPNTLVSVGAWDVASGNRTGPGCSFVEQGSPSVTPAPATRFAALQATHLRRDDHTVVVATSSQTSGASSATMTMRRCDTSRGALETLGSPTVDWPTSFVPGVSPDGTILPTRDADGTIQLLDVGSNKPITGRLLAPLTERMSLPTVTFSDDGRWFSATGSGGDVRVWETPPGSALERRTAVQASTVHVDRAGRVVALTSNGDVVDVASGRRLAKLPGVDTFPSAVGWSADGRRVAAAAPTSLLIADLAQHTTETMPTNRLACTSIDSIAFSPRADLLAVGCQPGFRENGVSQIGSNAAGLVQLMTLSTPSEVEPATPTNVWSSELTFSPDGAVLAVAEGGGAGAGLDLFDVRGRTLHRRTTLAGYGNVVQFMPDSRTLLRSHDGLIDRIDLSAGGARTTLFAPSTANVTGDVMVSPDGSLVASSEASTAPGEVSGIKLWDAATGQTLADITSDAAAPIRLLALTPNAVVAEEMSTDFSRVTAVLWFDLDAEDLAKRACARANRDLTPAEWRRYVGEVAYDHICSPRP